MKWTTVIPVVVAALLSICACMPIQPMPETMQSGGLTTSDDATVAAKIEVAMSAAGPAISKDATIMDWPTEPGGEFTVLREGTNRWTCFPPEAYMPEGVGHPICMDEVWLAYMKAKYVQADFPKVTTPGIAYMLDGGGGPSISDPFAREPAPGQEWTKNAPPHMMVLTPGDISGYGRTPGPEPWVMFPDTAYAHLMVGVPMPQTATSDASTTQGDASVTAKIQVAMRAAGPAITKDATIMDWPTEPGGEFIVLRDGTNRWTCFPPEEYMPEGVGHPICMDEVWLAYMKAKYARVEFPKVTTPGIAYMLDGGGGPSISDPFAREPAPGQEWTKNAPPHMMILTPGDLSSYSRTPGPEPWVMFPDTSYAHLMVAVPMPTKQ